MYIFGGQIDEDVDDIYPKENNYMNKYNFTEEKWYVEEPPDIDAPRQRAGHTAVIYKNFLYIFAGIFTTFMPLTSLLNQKPELHRYDFESKTWEYVKYTGEVSKLFGHTAIVYNNEMIIYGGGKDTGFEEEKQSNDVYIYDFENEFFKLVSTKNEKFPAREGHCAVLHKNSMIIFGGRSKNSRFNDIFQLNLLNNKDQYSWSKVNVKGQLVPSPRAGCTMVEWKDKLYVFGGFDGKFEMNELWSFNLKTGFWQQCTILNHVPNKIGLHSCAKVDNNDELKMYIFGGVAGDQLEDEYFNDFYEMIDPLGDVKISLLRSVLNGDYCDTSIIMQN